MEVMRRAREGAFYVLLAVTLPAPPHVRQPGSSPAPIVQGFLRRVNYTGRRVNYTGKIGSNHWPQAINSPSSSSPLKGGGGVGWG